MKEAQRALDKALKQTTNVRKILGKDGEPARTSKGFERFGAAGKKD
jgi:hypothetical protein